MKKEIDIYNYPRRLATTIKKVQNSPISERNKTLILEFKYFCAVSGIGLPRTVRYLGVLTQLAEILGLDFDKAIKADIMRVVSKIHENAKYAPWTKATYKIMLKRFYKWLKDTGDTYPEEVKWIKARIKLTETKLPANGDLLTEAEIHKLINTAEHTRDKALISVLYESGARVGEIATLQIGNIKFDEYGAILYVEGKTGARPIRILSSTPYLMTWLENHPFKNDKESPLWINIGSVRHNLSMRYGSIRIILKTLFTKAGINKRFNPHMFRHSRASFLADHLTEFQMNQYFGWIQGSKMPATYVHMNGTQTEASILRLNGIEIGEKNAQRSLNPIICPRCTTINAHDAKFCNKCAGILDPKTASELEQKKAAEQTIRKGSDEVMNCLMRDQEFLKLFVNKIKELGLADKIVSCDGIL